MGDECEPQFFGLFHKISNIFGWTLLQDAPGAFDPRKSALTLNPRVHFDFEEIQLHSAVFQNLVVEGADVKFRA